MISVYYDRMGLSGLKVGTVRGLAFMLGTVGSKTDSFTFNSATVLMGFYGETLSPTSPIISNLGVIVYFPQCYYASLNSGGDGQTSNATTDSDSIMDEDELSAQFVNYEKQ